MKTNVRWLRVLTVLALMVCTASPAMAAYNSTRLVLDDFPAWIDGGSGSARNYTQYVTANATSTRAKAGDVAMAVAKVIAWWQFPSQGTGTVAYEDARNASQYSVNLAATATGRPYAFSTMPVTLGATSTAAINQTVARLISDAAYAVQTRFYANSTADIGTATFFSTYFKFSAPTVVSGSSYASHDAWLNVFKNELASNYTGRGKGAPVVLRLTKYNSNQSYFAQYPPANYTVVVDGWQNDTGTPLVHLQLADGSSRWTTLNNASWWPTATYGYTNQTAVTGVRPVYNSFYPISPASNEAVKWSEGPFVFGDAGGRGCSWYNLKLTNGTTTNTATWVNASTAGCSDGVCTIYDNTYAVAAPGNWTWSISAWCTNDSTNWYQVNPNYANGTSYNAQLPATATLVSPSGAITAATSVDFVFNESQGITWYNIKVRNYNSAAIIDSWLSNSSICDSLGVCTATWAKVIAANSLTAITELPSGSFDWSVGGWGIGMANYTAYKPCYNPGDTPRNVQNITAAPKASNGTVISAFPAVTFNMTTTTGGVRWYDLWIGSPSSGSSWREKWLSSDEAYCNATSGACTYKSYITATGPYQVWMSYWYNNSGDWQQSGWSYGNFTAAPGSPTRKDISLPVEGSQIVGFQPNFKWNIDQNTSWQGVYLQKSGSTVACSPTTACADNVYWLGSEYFNGTSIWANSSNFQNAGLSGGDYTWKLQAWGAGNSSVATFTMGTFSVTTQPSTKATGLSPNGTATSGATTFSWTGGNSTWYGVVWAGAETGSYWASTEDACGGFGGTSCSVTVGAGNFTATGNYTYTIQGWGPNDGASVVTSGTATFTR